MSYFIDRTFERYCQEHRAIQWMQEAGCYMVRNSSGGAVFGAWVQVYVTDDMSDAQIFWRINRTLYPYKNFGSYPNIKQENVKQMASYDNDDNIFSADETSKLAGAKVARMMLPFLRTDVPNDALIDFSRLVAKWCGFAKDVDFMLSFVGVFRDYESANSQKRIAISERHEAD